MIAIEDVGEGPAVMLLHGSPSTTSDFAPVVAALRADHRVLVPVLPGYGGSARLPGVYSFARVQERLESALVERGVGELAVVGFSQGAHRALAFAASTRLAVSRVVAVAGYAALTPADQDAMRGLAAMLSAPGARLDSPELLAMLRPRFLAPRYQGDAARIAQLDRWFTAVDAPVVVDELRAVIASDLRAALPRLSIPVIAIVGELDAACPPSYSEEIVRLCRHGRLVRIPDHGHALLIEQPGETAAAIRDALR